MKTNFENIKTKASEFFKTDKAKIGGACVCALLICVGVGFGVNAIASQNSQNLPSKALENTVSENTKTEGDNNENKPENAIESTSENTDEVTVNDKGEVIDENGNVVAESVEQYNATQNSQTHPVATSNPSSGNNNTPQTQPSGSTQPAHTHSWATRCIQEAWDEPIKTWQLVSDYYQCNKCGSRDIGDDHMMRCKGSYTLHENYDWVVTGYTHHEAITETYCTGCGATR